jgi:hypothetical protein
MATIQGSMFEDRVSPPRAVALVLISLRKCGIISLMHEKAGTGELRMPSLAKQATTDWTGRATA